MASMVAKPSCPATSNHGPSSVLVQEKGSRNKRKYRADPPLGDLNKITSSSQDECPSYDFSAEKFEISSSLGQIGACDLCSISQEFSAGLKLDLGLSNGGSPDVGIDWPRGELEVDEFQDVDWSDLTEAQLVELILCNLDTIFKAAIKKVVASGFTEEVAIKAISRSGICFGCKDIMSNVVDNTLAFLRSGQEIDQSREHYFEDLQQLEKYILAELVCVLREVRPYFSTGDAMWCLLVSDMSVSHACTMDSDPSNAGVCDGTSNEGSTNSTPQLKAEAKSSELNFPKPLKPISPISCAHSSQSDGPATLGVPNLTKPKDPLFSSVSVSDKELQNSASDVARESFNVAGNPQTSVAEEKIGSSRRVHSNITKREYMLRQKSLHVDKNFRTYGPKGPSRAGKVTGLGSLMLDKKLKSVSGSTAVNFKNASLKISKAMGIDVAQDNGNHNPTTIDIPSSSLSFNLENNKTASPFSKINVLSSMPAPSSPLALPATNTSSALPAAETDLSLSLPTKSNEPSVPISCNTEPSTSSFVEKPYEKSLGQWFPKDKKDEMVLKLVPRARELQSQLQEWMEWANQKVMQAARRLSKDKAELKTLKQEKEEVERLKKEKQTLEENTKKKLSEMEHALCKASGQVELANSAVRRLEVENAALRQEMEVAKLRATESAATFQEVSKREKKTLVNVQSWEKTKMLFQEEHTVEKRKLKQLIQELEQARDVQEQLEGRGKMEARAKDELLMQAASLRKEREQIEASLKAKEDTIKLKAENNLLKYKSDIQKLEKEISQLRLKTDSSRIAALKRGIDGSYASRLIDTRNSTDHNESWTPNVSESMKDLYEYSGTGSVKRERECVMCLSEEMSVVFLPCAHQVVCTTCNELHEKQGMKDCPSCRSPIQRRIPVRYTRS
ncbi:putative E3 ubiquitin-protein ligase RF298 isoform X1 [Cucurbita moschata]|uniref:E3 ubiquitin-protein ligase RF298 isoform X1 n=1 Tax=Cucurbita moschata TaxID=3662 RepID=A0A6J1GLE6_CUCMO|nr:putative E3 ubiquitin-protein ligase RF298 isoform X1 [Cucurbita moschata]XP_022952799.1 putative E3 ubiquitin-protein ligase RF298 isoform X1 [Cucurbita moschata]XP_022952880.1 putative E3 ubiquitin-protein ligase RF298 isoform X1 [Cucurbita moschata]XP_022952965.1 putative E3 ubiquitin-protein ligase RF298 isoform X1 [Cucurbita moschata]